MLWKGAGVAWSETMKNLLEIEGRSAVVSFDPELGMFRGEFLGLSGARIFMPIASKR